MSLKAHRKAADTRDIFAAFDAFLPAFPVQHVEAPRAPWDCLASVYVAYRLRAGEQGQALQFLPHRLDLDRCLPNWTRREQEAELLLVARCGSGRAS